MTDLEADSMKVRLVFFLGDRYLLMEGVFVIAVVPNDALMRDMEWYGIYEELNNNGRKLQIKLRIISLL